MIGLAVFATVAVVVYFIVRYVFERGMTRVLPSSLAEAERFMKQRYSVGFEVWVCTKYETGVSRSLFGRNQILMNSNDMTNTEWLKDFNMLARETGFKEMDTLGEMSMFLLFHECRHILSNEGKVHEYHDVKNYDVNWASLPPIFHDPETFDAHMFAFKELDCWRTKA